MTIEDQAANLFAKANPVPSLDLLDPVEPVDLDSLTDRSERSGVMTELKTKDASREPRPRRHWLVPALGTLLVALVVIPTLVRSPGGERSPTGVAEAYMAAVAQFDWEAAQTLFDPALDAAEVERMVDLELWEHDRAVGWVRDSQGCEETSAGEGGTLVRCSYSIQTDLGRALGLEPVGGLMSIVIDESHIQTISNQVVGDTSPLNEAWDVFGAWVEENHPDDVDAMYDAGGFARTDAASIALWEQHVDEFVAEMGGG